MLAAPFLLARPNDRLVAAIPLLDAAACAFVGRTDLAIASVVAFAVTILWRRLFS